MKSGINIKYSGYKNNLIILESYGIEKPEQVTELQLWINNSLINKLITKAITKLTYFNKTDSNQELYAVYIPIKYQDNTKYPISLTNEETGHTYFNGSFRVNKSYFEFHSNENTTIIDVINQGEIQKNQLIGPTEQVNEQIADDLVIFTIASRNYLAYVRVLFSSIKKFHPEIKLILCLADEIDEYLDLSQEQFSIIEAKNIEVPNFLDMTARYDIMEFNTAVKPFMFKWLFAQENVNKAIYFDPDIKIYNSLTHLIRRLNSHTSALLTPHVNRPYRDELHPNDQDILQAGTFNLGFIALRNCDESNNFLNWWARKLETTCIVELNNGLFVDQKWCDFAPSFLPNLFIIRDPGYNVAYWNLFEREITKQEDTWYSSGSPLVFFHFSGVDPNKKTQISKHQNRHTLDQVGECSKLYQEYFSELLEFSYSKFKSIPYSYNYFGCNYEFNRIIKLLYRRLNIIPNELNTKNELISLVREICNGGHEPLHKAFKGKRLSRLFNSIYELREDLSNSFSASDEDSLVKLISWFDNDGRKQYDIPNGLKVTPNMCVNDTLFGRPLNSRFREYGSITRLMEILWNARNDLQTAFPIDSIASAHAFQQWWTDMITRDYPRSVPCGSKYESVVQSNLSLAVGINLIGYLNAEMGMGEHVRSSIAAVQSSELSHSVLNFSVGVKTRQEAELEHKVTTNQDCRINLFHINADQMLEAYLSIGSQFFDSKYNIGFWLWELARFPAEWEDSFDFVDELWAPSTFIQRSLSEKTDKPVVYMPLCVRLPDFLRLDRTSFGIPSDGFIFLTVFDFLSYFERKNPIAAVKAFIHAFSEDSNVFLIIKTMNVDLSSEKWHEFLTLTSCHRNIIIINKTFKKSEVLSLVNCCNCYVSTHRAEGFGYGPAEAMLLCKPVILTNYSATTDFAFEMNAFPINFQLVPVSPKDYPMSYGQSWAEPDVDHCTFRMLEVYRDYESALRKGSLARQTILSNHSPTAVGYRYKSRVDTINKLYF